MGVADDHALLRTKVVYASPSIHFLLSASLYILIARLHDSH